MAKPTSTRQAQATTYLSSDSGPQRTEGGSIPNAARKSRIHSFTLPPQADEALVKLGQVYEGLNASQIVARALAELLDRSSPGSSASSGPAGGAPVKSRGV